MNNFDRYKSLLLGIKNTLLLFTISILISNKLSGQSQMDIGQYMFYQPIINPAASGSYNTFSCALYARQQWASIEGAPTKLLAHALLPMKNNSISTSFSQESIGVHSLQKLMGSYSYRVNLTPENYLSLGFSAGLQFIQSKYNDVESTELQDNEFLSNNSFTSPDFNFGLYYFNEKSYAGFSIPSFVHSEVNSSDGNASGKTDFAPKYWNYYLHGGHLFFLSNRVDLNVSSLMRIATNAPIDMDFNFQLLIDKTFGTGISYRTRKEVLLFLNIRLTNGIMAGYSYHSYLGVTKNVLSGHEVIITFNLKKSTPVIIQTPRF